MSENNAFRVVWLFFKTLSPSMWNSRVGLESLQGPRRAGILKLGSFIKASRKWVASKLD